MEEVIKKLQEIRISKDMSLSEVARRMCCERARLSEIENGKGGLTLKRMLQWADALGVKVTINFE